MMIPLSISIEGKISCSIQDGANGLRQSAIGFVWATQFLVKKMPPYTYNAVFHMNLTIQ